LWLAFTEGRKRGFDAALEATGERAAERARFDEKWKQTRAKLARERLQEAQRALDEARREIAEADPYSVDAIDLFSPAFYELKRDDREKVLRAALETLRD
jgi:hypothetical protein